MVTRSQDTSFGCQGLKEVPSSQLESDDDWFQRVLLKNAKHASVVGLKQTVPIPILLSFSWGSRNVTWSRAFAYVTPDWLLGRQKQGVQL